MSGTNSFSSQLTQHQEALDAQLSSYATTAIPGLQRLLTARGKRLRPRLVFTIVLAAGKVVDKSVIMAACAIEMVHLASLIHDDALDNGTRRWGTATINAQEGAAMALLAGDYLLAQAGGLAAHVSPEMAQIVAAAIVRMCEGQALETSDQYNTSRSESAYIEAVQGKTAALFEAASRAGAHLSQLDTETTKCLLEYAQNMGIGYQILNDLDDFAVVDSQAAKVSTPDYVLGNYTLPVILSLQGSNQKKLRKSLQDVSQHAVVRTILEADSSLQMARLKADQYLGTAEKVLQKVQNPILVKQLSTLV